MKYYLIAGEASGDLHASNLMTALKKTDPDTRFRCWGGDLMQAAGGELVRHYRDLAFMGFIEVLFNLRTILGNLRFCKKDLLEFRPDVLILVDYPGFNLRMAKFAHDHNIRVFYYISPQIWAWRASRVRIIKRSVDHLFAILPFEKDFYKGYGYEADFIGHPLLDVLSPDHSYHQPDEFRTKNGLDAKPLIALLPGSRRQEIRKMLTVMLKVAGEFPNHDFVIAGAPSVPEPFYRSVPGCEKTPIIFGQTYNLLKNADAALITSGTATLEAAIIGTPQVVCYKGSTLSYLLARLVVRVRYISLVNLILQEQAVTELIQHEMNPVSLKRELHHLLDEPVKRLTLQKKYDKLRQLLGGSGASMNAARLMNRYLTSEK